VEFGALPTAAMRVLIAAVFLLPIVAWRGLWPELKRSWKPVLAIGVVSSGLPFAFFSFALLSITTGLSAILNATAPLFTALVAWWWMKDRPTGSRVAGLAIGFVGVALLSWDKATFRAGAGGFAPAWAVLACLGATLCYGIAATATKRYLTGVPPLVTAGGSQVGAALALGIPAAVMWPSHMPGANAWWALVAVGVLCTGVAYVLYFRLIAQTGPARAVAVTFVIPVFALFYGAMFLGEAVTPWMVFCGLIIVAGTALSTGLLKLPSMRTQS
jgi:drug/metabolite transporter (DMT)-like permease